MAQAETTKEARLSTDDLLAEALALGMTHEAAGRQAGVSSKTVQRRLGDPNFVALRDERRHVHVQAACGRLIALAETAMEVLVDALTDDDAVVRLKAVDLVLRQLVPFRKHADVPRATRWRAIYPACGDHGRFSPSPNPATSTW